MNELSIIIVNYNVKSYLEQALRSIQKALKGIASEIIVVDNASSDGSGAMVRQLFPDVMLIENQGNPGFAKANNQAIEQSQSEFICLINPDTLVQENIFRVCLDYMKSHPDVGMTGCKIINPDGTLQLACRRSIPTPWVAFTKVSGLSRLFPKSKLFGRYNLTYADPNEITEVEAISGSFMMVRRDVVEKIGGLDETFFMYGEDLDWCYRIGKAGWKIVYLPGTQMVHYKGRSTREASFDELRVFYEAMSLFVEKHYRKGWSFFPRWMLMLGITLRGGLSMILRLCNRLVIPMVDFLLIQLSFIVALLLRFHNLGHWSAFEVVSLIYSAIWLLSFAALGLYKPRVLSFARALFAVMIGLVLNTSITFFLPQFAYSRYVVLASGLANLIWLSGWRLFIRLAARIPGFPFFGRIGKTLFRRRAVIAGTDPMAQAVYKRMSDQVGGDYDVIGLVATDPKEVSEAEYATLPILGSLGDIKRLVHSQKIQDIIFTSESVNFKKMLELMTLSRSLHVEFKMITQNMDVIIGHTSVDSIEDISLVPLELQIFSGTNSVLKRLFDILVAFFLLVPSLFGWLILKLTPSIHIQTENISDGYGGVFPVRRVRRETGKKFLIDMSPLILGVLCGKLSFVGTEIIPCEPGVQGLGFKPGLTGLVQVNRKKELSPSDKEKINHFYLKNYSILLDIEILMRAMFKF